MEEDNTNTKNDSNWLFSRKAPVTIVGVILIAITTAAVYDFFIKPGINGVSRFVFDTLTLGSQRIVDYSFNTAALDPTAVPSLILLVVLAVVVIDILLRKFIQITLLKNKRLKSRPPKSKIKFTVRVVLPIALLINVAIIFILLITFNQAVVTWRVFHANLAIISPVITNKEALEFKAKFSEMHTELDYRSIEMDMKNIAEDNGITLRDESPW